MAKGKYEYWLTEEGLVKIEGWARDGLTEEQIAYNMGINRGTLNTYKNKFESINNALKKGKEVVDRQVENALLKRALGYEYEEVKKEVDGTGAVKITKTIKQIPPDTTAQIFWLKNRKPIDWRDKKEVNTNIKEHSSKFSSIIEQITNNKNNKEKMKE